MQEQEKARNRWARRQSKQLPVSYHEPESGHSDLIYVIDSRRMKRKHMTVTH